MGVTLVGVIVTVVIETEKENENAARLLLCPLPLPPPVVVVVGPLSLLLLLEVGWRGKIVVGVVGGAVAGVCRHHRDLARVGVVEEGIGMVMEARRRGSRGVGEIGGRGGGRG